METVAGECDGIKAGITGTGTTVTGQQEPGPAGWLLQAAIGDVNNHWKTKTDRCGAQWTYYASAVRATGDAITAEDREVAFTFPSLGEGEADIPVPMPFNMYDSGPASPPEAPPLPLPPTGN